MANKLTAFDLADMNGDGRLDIVTVTSSQLAVGIHLQFPRVALATTTIDFGSGTYLTPTAPLPVTLTVSGSAPLKIRSLSVTGDFSIGSGGTCPSSAFVEPGTSCTIDVIFRATAAGLRTGQLTIEADPGDIPRTPIVVNLRGRSDPAIVLDPTSLDFGNQQVGRTSDPLFVTLRNTGAGPLIITSMANSGPFQFNGSACPALVLPGTSCAIEFRFTPPVTGVRTGSFAVASNVDQQNVSLQGTGVTGAATLSPSTLTFPARAIHTDGAAQTVTLTNTGTGNLTIASIGLGGNEPHEFAIVGGTCPLGASTLAPSASCTIDLVFRALGKGAHNATLHINSSGAPADVHVSGIGFGNGVPFIQQLAPASVAPVSGDRLVIVKGAYFVPGATVLFNGTPLPTTVVNGGELATTIPAAATSIAGAATITVRNPDPGGEISNTILFPIAWSATPTFTRTDVPIGAAPQGVAIGDFNGDGIVDLAVTNCGSNDGRVNPAPCEPGAVAIRLGTGTGTFAPGTEAPIPGTLSADRIVAGDFNGDRHLDLVVSHTNTTASVRLTTLLGNGTGRFTVLPVSSNAVSHHVCATGHLAAADFTRDGNLDLVVTDPFCSNQLLAEGDGTGGLRATNNPIASVFGGGAPALADLDGDGLLDISRPVGGGVALSKGTDTGTFSTTNYVWPDHTPQGLAAGDLNGDGHPDLVMKIVDVFGSSASIAVYLSDGAGFHDDGAAAGFTLAQSLPLAGTAEFGDSVAQVAPLLADLNADGFLDIAVFDADDAVRSFSGTARDSSRRRGRRKRWVALPGRSRRST